MLRVRKDQIRVHGLPASLPGDLITGPGSEVWRNGITLGEHRDLL